MNHRELAVLEAVNIASTRYRRPHRDYEATAAQVAEVLNTDDRIQGSFRLTLTAAQVGSTLGRMASSEDRLRPLVEKVDSRRWHARVKSFAALLTVTAALTAQPAEGHVWSGCQKRACRKHVVRPFNGIVERIAGCESGRRWHYNGPSGFDGGLQFSPESWSKTGSRFTYAWQASGLEQKYRAVLWAQRIGWAWSSTAGWPVCGRLA